MKEENVGTGESNLKRRKDLTSKSIDNYIGGRKKERKKESEI